MEASNNIASPISTNTTAFALVIATTTQTNKGKVSSANWESVGGGTKF